MADGGFTQKVREAARKRILILPHAIHQMTSIERMISTDEVETVVVEGELIEDYPEDKRGHSCLMLGFGDEGRPVHVACAQG